MRYDLHISVILVVHAKMRSFWVSISMIFLQTPSEAFNFCFFLFPSFFIFLFGVKLGWDGFGLVGFFMGVFLFVSMWIGLLRFI